MRTFKPLACVAILLCISLLSQGQILNRVKQRAEQRANQKIDKAIDKGLDKTEEAAKTDKNKKDTTKTTTTKKETSSNSQTTSTDSEAATKNPADLKPMQNSILYPAKKLLQLKIFHK